MLENFFEKNVFESVSNQVHVIKVNKKFRNRIFESLVTGLYLIWVEIIRFCQLLNLSKILLIIE